MLNEYYEIESRPTFGKLLSQTLKHSWKGILLFIGAMALLWWNEGHAVRTHRSINEGREIVLHIASDHIELKNNLKLVHLVGVTAGKDKIIDSKTGQIFDGFCLKRQIESFQWQEKNTKEKNKTIYTKTWSNDIINSDHFDDSLNHRNPKTRALKNWEKVVDQPRIGVFLLGNSLINQINEFEPFAIQSNPTLAKLDGKIFTQVDDKNIIRDYIFIGHGTYNDPEIGDMKIWYEGIPFDVYSVISKQNDEKLEEYKSNQGANLSIIQRGTHSSDNLFDTLDSNNTILLWILRFTGLGLMYKGIHLMFSFILVIFNKIPILNTIILLATKAASGVLTVIFGGTIIGFAWIYYRPIIGTTILILVSVIVLIFYKKGLHEHLSKK